MKKQCLLFSDSYVSPLLVDTLARLDNYSSLQIANETGLPYGWIRKLANRDIKDPGVNRIAYLNDYLRAKSISDEKHTRRTKKVESMGFNDQE